MRSNLLSSIPSDTIYGGLGISEERRAEITKTIDKICKEEMEKEGGSRSSAITQVWNSFENDNECAFAMYILSHEEEGVAVHSLFRLPEDVGEEVED